MNAGAVSVAWASAVRAASSVDSIKERALKYIGIPNMNYEIHSFLKGSWALLGFARHDPWVTLASGLSAAALSLSRVFPQHCHLQYVA